MGGLKARWLPAITAAPVLGLGITWMVVVVLGWQGHHLWWRVEALNLAEAAALRDRGEVARQLQAGADPRMPRVIRGGVLGSEPVVLAPMQAAILAGRAEIVRLLIDSGLTLDPNEWRQLWCSTNHKRVRTVLATVRPDGTPDDCPVGEDVVATPAAETHRAPRKRDRRRRRSA